nr:iron ABC transporter permease [Pantoea sp. 201603H]
MKSPVLFGLLLLTTLICIGLAMLAGPYPFPFAQLLATWAHHDNAAVPPQAALLFWHIRLPRILAALLIGGALSLAGATFQGMFRNPLVSPDILGVSAGAGLGACFAIWLGLPIVMIQASAFCGGVLVVTSVWFMTRKARRHDPLLTLILVGIALGTLCGAGISLIKVLADPYTQLPTVTFWLLGGLSSLTLADLVTITPLIIVGAAPILLLRWRVNVLSLSDDEALSMGINVTRLRLILILSATLVTASAVSVAGMIGWIGLAVPHIGRLLVGCNHQRLLPVAAALGAILLLLTDTLARSIASTEIPLGILTAFIGAPIFLVLLLRGRRV